MEIQSAFNSGIQGLKAAEEKATQAAISIAEQTISIENATAQNEINAKPEPLNSESLTESVVNLKVAEFQNSASVAVVKTADESLGTLLDVRV